MPTSNGFTLAANNCDIEIENAAGDVYGFHSAIPTIAETRASQITASTGESSPTYKSAEPFETLEYTDWSYGMGQVNGDRADGGPLGQGGNPAAYFYGDCFSLRTGKLLPGMARDQIYNTVAGQTTPITNGLDPVAGDEFEVPRGIVPCNGYYVTQTKLTQAGNITGVRVLMLFAPTQPNTNLTITVILVNPLGFVALGTYTLTLTPAQINNYSGWSWVSLPLTSGTGVNAANNYFLFACDGPARAAFGSFIDSTNTIRPYFQLLKGGTTPYKYWQAAPARFEQLNNGGTYINIAITKGAGTTSAYFNTAATGTAGTAGTSPERLLNATLLSSIVFNLKAYISYNDGGATFGLFRVDAPTAATNAGVGAGDATTVVAMLSPVEHEGNLLFFERTGRQLYKWNGNIPATGGDAPVALTNAGVIGQSLVGANGLTIFQGSLYVLKPEGVFKITMDIADISTAKPPTVARVWTPPGGVTLPYNGTWFTEHQGKLYWNWKNLVVELSMGEDQPTIQYLNPNPPWYRQSYYSYVNGLTSDGQNLYASVNNFGISAWNAFGWHPITEFYESVGVEGQASGLRWVPSPQGGPDFLFCGDGRTCLKIPLPNNFQPYTTQIYQNHQNKCGYWISSEWTGSLAEAEKLLRSVILRAVPNGWSYKLVGVIAQPGDNSSFSNILIKTFFEGLFRDSWNALVNLNKTIPMVVATAKLDTFNAPIANTLAPAYFVSSDFDNQQYQSKKLAVATTDTTATPPKTENVSRPMKVAKTQFILYFWNPVAGQASTTNTEIMSVDAVVIKHLPKLKYVARYQVRLDLTKVAHIGSLPKGVVDVEASATWLRNQWVAGDSLYFRFYDMTGSVIQVEGIIQGNHADVFPLDKGNTKIFPQTADFAILSLTEEG